MNMIERVARAIVTEWNNRCEANAMFHADVDAAWPSMVPSARAAIEAMREPTLFMIEAGEMTDDPYETSPCEVHWPAMIDAALKETD